MNVSMENMDRNHHPRRGNHHPIAGVCNQSGTKLAAFILNHCSQPQHPSIIRLIFFTKEIFGITMDVLVVTITDGNCTIKTSAHCLVPGFIRDFARLFPCTVLYRQRPSILLFIISRWQHGSKAKNVRYLFPALFEICPIKDINRILWTYGILFSVTNELKKLMPMVAMLLLTLRRLRNSAGKFV